MSVDARLCHVAVERCITCDPSTKRQFVRDEDIQSRARDFPGDRAPFSPEGF
jgi:hypothetical protein